MFFGLIHTGAAAHSSLWGCSGYMDTASRHSLTVVLVSEKQTVCIGGATEPHNCQIGVSSCAPIDSHLQPWPQIQPIRSLTISFSQGSPRSDT